MAFEHDDAAGEPGRALSSAVNEGIVVVAYLAVEVEIRQELVLEVLKEDQDALTAVVGGVCQDEVSGHARLEEG